MQRILRALLLAVLFVGDASAFSWNGAKEQQLLTLLRNYQTLRQPSVLSASVTVRGSVVFAGSVHPNSELIPNGGRILHRIGSVTKQFTAAGILALIEDQAIVPFSGKPLTLDTSLDDFFTDIPQWHYGGTNTVRRLLTMRSNIPDYLGDPAGISVSMGPMKAWNILQQIKKYSPIGPPLSYAYSNSNYFLLSQIIQTMTNAGKPSTNPAYQNYVRARILDRAAMQDTRFIGETPLAGAAVAPPGLFAPARFDKPDWPLGAGDLVNSVADMAKWNTALFGGNVIGSVALQALLNPAAQVSSGPYSGCAYAMGWFVCNFPAMQVYQHEGKISGFMASNAVAKSQAGGWASVTTMANTDAAEDIALLTRAILQLAQ